MNTESFHARGEKGAILKMSDVQSLYPHKGVTDAFIDFFVRYILLAELYILIYSSANGFASLTHSRSANVRIRRFIENGSLLREDITFRLVL